MSRAQESLYVFQPPESSSPIRSIEDYLNRKFDHRESELRAKRYHDILHSLEEMDQQIRLQKLATNRDMLEKWLGSSSDRVHTSFVVNLDYKELLQLEEGTILGHKDWLYASTYSTECPNLKSIVRNVVARLTKRAEDTDADRRLLYDFDLIRRFKEEKGDECKIVIVLEGADVFNKAALAQFYNYVMAYDDLPIRLILTLSLSPSLFEEQLPRHTVELIDGQLFESESSYEYLQATLKVCEASNVQMGGDFIAILQTQPLSRIRRIVEYMLVSHFTTNPIALLTKENVREHLDLIRRLPSFRRLENYRNFLADDPLVEKCLAVLEGSVDQTGFLSEILVNNVDLYYNVFEPHYRHALETALCEPGHFYPHPDAPANMRSMIAVCLLYTLVRGADLYVNIYETYVKFRELMARPAGLELDDEKWGRISVAWFQQAVFELTQMGVVRNTKRKANSLEKVAFKGV